MAEPRITECTVGPCPDPWDLYASMPEVKVKFDDGTEKTLFSFYPDELSFSPSEFIGLTEQQGHELFHCKDVAYLRS